MQSQITLLVIQSILITQTRERRITRTEDQTKGRDCQYIHKTDKYELISVRFIMSQWYVYSILSIIQRIQIEIRRIWIDLQFQNKLSRFRLDQITYLCVPFHPMNNLPITIIRIYPFFCRFLPLCYRSLFHGLFISWKITFKPWMLQYLNRS